MTSPFRDITLGGFTALDWVAEGGYKWASDVEPSDPAATAGWSAGDTWLVPQSSIFAPTDAVASTPLQAKGLHREFGRLEHSQARILKFAGTYGFLLGADGRIGLKESGGTPSRLTTIGEPFRRWTDEISKIRWLFELWDLARLYKSKALSTYIRWKADPETVRLISISTGGVLQREKTLRICRGVHRQSGETEGHLLDEGDVLRSEMIATSETHEGGILLSKFKSHDVVEPARWLVHREVNSMLATETCLRTYPFQDQQLRVSSRSLLGTIYVHFALELAGSTLPPVMCNSRRCNNFFIPEHGSQLYCDRSCSKLENYYRRKEREAS